MGVLWLRPKGATNTKFEILYVSMKFFLEKGYTKSYITTIAKTLQMSTGNLTFWFPTNAIYSKMWSNSRIALGLIFILYLSKMFFLQFCKNYFCIYSIGSFSNFLLGFEDCLVDAIYFCKFII